MLVITTYLNEATRARALQVAQDGLAKNDVQALGMLGFARAYGLKPRSDGLFECRGKTIQVVHRRHRPYGLTLEGKPRGDILVLTTPSVMGPASIDIRGAIRADRWLEETLGGVRMLPPKKLSGAGIFQRWVRGHDTEPEQKEMTMEEAIANHAQPV